MLVAHAVKFVATSSHNPQRMYCQGTAKTRLEPYGCRSDFAAYLKINFLMYGRFSQNAREDFQVAHRGPDRATG